MRRNRLLDQEALVSRDAMGHILLGLSLVVPLRQQAYRTIPNCKDYHIALQESLMTTLITHVSSQQGQLSAALGQIQALQARGQTHVDDREGAARVTSGTVQINETLKIELMAMATEATILTLELEELSGCAVTVVQEDGISVPYQQLCCGETKLSLLLSCTLSLKCSNMVETPHEDCHSRNVSYAIWTRRNLKMNKIASTILPRVKIKKIEK
ncbi:hypothetical protein Tco_0570706 [Tanacetum coccineum]